MFEVLNIKEEFKNITNIKEDVKEYLSSLNLIFKEDVKIKVNGKVVKVDFLIKEYKLCIDCVRLYENSELFVSNKSLAEKHDLFENTKYQLLQIFETLWYKDERTQNCLKEKISYLCHKAENRVYARDCYVAEVTSATVKKDFINANHVQGTAGSCINLGLYTKDEDKLVAMLTFCKPRLAMGQKAEKFKNIIVYELSRYCTLSNYSVVGGCSKLFKYFKEHYEWDKIITYADKRLSKANLYFNVGFMYHHESEGSYYYFKPITKEEWNEDNSKLEMKYRFNFRKQELLKRYKDVCDNWNELYPNENLTELNISHSQGFIKTYDSGTYYLEMINENGCCKDAYEEIKLSHNNYCENNKLNNFIIK